MKLPLSILFLLMTFGFANAQKPKVLNLPTEDDKPIHFGFCLGINTMTFAVKTNYAGYLQDSLVADVSSPDVGFHIQIISNYRLGDYFDLRFLPGVALGQRKLNFFKNNKLYDSNHLIESNFIELPLLLKYKAKRLNNFRPYMICGPNMRIDLAKTMKEDNQMFLAIKRLDWAADVGAGIDFYLTYFKLAVELKLSHGFNDMLYRRASSRPEFQNAIESLHSSLWMLSFHFE